MVKPFEVFSNETKTAKSVTLINITVIDVCKKVKLVSRPRAFSVSGDRDRPPNPSRRRRILASFSRFFFASLFATWCGGKGHRNEVALSHTSFLDVTNLCQTLPSSQLLWRNRAKMLLADSPSDINLRNFVFVWRSVDVRMRNKCYDCMVLCSGKWAREFTGLKMH